MSSSKVFKEDTLFTPLSLVRQHIDPPKKITEEPDLEPEPVLQADLQDADLVPDLAQPEEAFSDEVPPPPSAESVSPSPEEPPPDPEPPEEEPVDAEAIWQEGYNQGSADSAAKMHGAFDQSIRSLSEACQKIDNLHNERMASSHADMVNLVISLTEKILGQELATPRNQIALTLEAALEQAIAGEEFHVTLHPDDLAFAEERAPFLINSIRGLEHLVFKADPDVRRGGCLLESVSCTVDATLDGKLASVRELLTEHPELLIPVEDEPESLPPESLPIDDAGAAQEEVKP